MTEREREAITITWRALRNAGAPTAGLTDEKILESTHCKALLEMADWMARKCRTAFDDGVLDDRLRQIPGNVAECILTAGMDVIEPDPHLEEQMKKWGIN